MSKLQKIHFDLEIKYSREHYSKKEVRKSAERLLKDAIGDRFGAFSAIRKVEVK